MIAEIVGRASRVALGLGFALCLVVSARGADTLTWNTNKNLVSADIKSTHLFEVLEKVAGITGWHVFVEPDTARTVSTKFQDLPPGDALRMFVGDVSFALVPGTNTPSKLYVFRTTRQNATQRLAGAKEAPKATAAKVIPNELIVRLKPGANIDEIARLLGAKVIGKIEGLNAYRLQFEDAAAAEAAREKLSSNSEVASVENNYSVERPTTPVSLPNATASMPQLTLNPPSANGKIVVGLIDTAVQSLGKNLDQFLLKSISEAGAASLDPSSPSHGTSMAEALLRSLQSITKGSTSVQILPVDVYGSSPTTSTFAVAQGIYDAVNAGANPINLSLGSSADSPILADIIKQALAKNILVIAAAGNEPVTTPFYPAAYTGVNAVTAVEQGQLASYANRGSFVNLGAPGSALVVFDSQTFGVQGTSVSSAYLSGLAAGYMDVNKTGAMKAQSFLQGNFGIKINTTP